MRFKRISLIIIFCCFSGAAAAGQGPLQRLRAYMTLRDVLHAGHSAALTTKNLVAEGSSLAWRHKRFLASGGMRGMVWGYLQSKFFRADAVNNQVVETEEVQSGPALPNFINESTLLTCMYAFQTAVYVSAGVTEVEKLPKESSLLNKVKSFFRAVCRNYGTDVMYGATMPLLSEFPLWSYIPCPFLMRCFIAGVGGNMLHAGLENWFVSPCMRYGAYARRLAQQEGLISMCKCIASNAYKKTVTLKRCEKKGIMAHFGGAERAAARSAEQTNKHLLNYTRVAFDAAGV